MERQPNTQYILSLSYGKDSIACLEAIKLLGYPLDRIVHAEIWATDTIQADLPPMVKFKEYADRIIKERYGIEVEHICAMRDGERLTYEKLFYHKPVRKAERERERERDGWQRHGARCGATSQLKRAAITRINSRISANQRNMVQLDAQITSHSKGFLSQEGLGARSSKRPKPCGGICEGFLIPPNRAG